MTFAPTGASAAATLIPKNARSVVTEGCIYHTACHPLRD
eukprot:XP_001708235.1 Hypothetical protein GL50803_2725 [Giardia lamblia ATCC 50803]